MTQHCQLTCIDDVCVRCHIIQSFRSIFLHLWCICVEKWFGAFVFDGHHELFASLNRVKSYKWPFMRLNSRKNRSGDNALGEIIVQILVKAIEVYGTRVAL